MFWTFLAVGVMGAVLGATLVMAAVQGYTFHGLGSLTPVVYLSNLFVIINGINLNRV